MSLRPLTRVSAGEYVSANGRFTFVSGRVAGASGGNADAWHTYEGETACGERQPTLRDAVVAAERAYGSAPAVCSTCGGVIRWAAERWLHDETPWDNPHPAKRKPNE